MPTSSIFSNIVIRDPKKAATFVDALDESSRDPERKPSAPNTRMVTDIEAIRKLMSKSVRRN